MGTGMRLGAAGCLVITILACGGGGGAASGPAPAAPPTLITSPTSIQACVTQSVAFTVVADGARLAYQWKHNGVAVSGGTGATLNLADLRVEHGGSYSVTVSNAGGSVTSGEATLQVANSVQLAPDIKPFGLFIAGDGRKWIASPQTDLVTVNNPATGQWAKVECGSGSRPTGIIQGPDQNVWVTLNGTASAGQIIPQTAALKKLLVGKGPTAIARGLGSEVWCTLSGEDKVARVTMAGQVSAFPVSAGSVPTGIAVAADGTTWFTEFQAGRIGCIRPAGTVQEFDCVLPNSKPEGIAVGPDGSIWYTDKGNGKVVKFRGSEQVPAARGLHSGAFALSGALKGATVLDLSAVDAVPSHIAVDKDGKSAWVTEAGTGRVSRVAVGEERYTVDLDATSGKPAGVAQGPDGSVWVVQEEARVLTQVPVTKAPITVEVTPAGPVAMFPGANQSFTAKVNGTADLGVVWSVAEPGGGSLVPQGATATYTAPPTPGRYTLKAASRADPNQFGRVTVEVKAIQAPSFTSYPRDIPLGVGEGIQYTIAASDPQGYAITYSLIGAPAWAVYQSVDNKLIMMPDAAGSFFFKLRATNAKGLFGEVPLTVTVNKGVFTVTGHMGSARSGHTATLLPNGKVLLAGGWSPAMTAGAELFDPLSRSFSPVASMSVPRVYHSATLLRTGQVFISGGNVSDAPEEVEACELFDPLNNTFAVVGNMTGVGRHAHTATLLPDGRVLLVGGDAVPEIFDPIDKAFTQTAPLKIKRFGHSATLLSNGKVLIAGGMDAMSGNALDSLELFDPLTGTSVVIGAMKTARGYHRAAVLSDGRVLIYAGMKDQNTYVDAAELFDPSVLAIVGETSMGPRMWPPSVLLGNGRLLITGGYSGTSKSPSLLFDGQTPGSGFVRTGSLVSGGRYSHTATLLPDGKVLVAGGQRGSDCLATAELYDPQDLISNQMIATPPMQEYRRGATATRLPDGKVLVAGGWDEHRQGPGTASAESYDSLLNRYSPCPGGMQVWRKYATATLLPNGKVLITGGNRSAFADPEASAELYDPATGRFQATGSMTWARAEHSASLLPDGKVLVVGGDASGGGTAEIYDPVTGTFGVPILMTQGRVNHCAVNLPNGEILVMGGAYIGKQGIVAEAEIFDPMSKTFRGVGSMTVPRVHASATLLPDGRVFIGGGFDGSVGLRSTELYDWKRGAFAPGPLIGWERYHHTATLLPDGTLLLVGGFGKAGVLVMSERYDPMANSVQPGPYLPYSKADHAAVLLGNGKVLITGTDNSSCLY